MISKLDMTTKRCVVYMYVHRVWFNLFLQTVKKNPFQAYQVICMVFCCENVWTQIAFKVFKCNSFLLKFQCNSSFFKLTVFEKAKVGCRNRENESLKFDKKFVLFLITAVK